MKVLRLNMILANLHVDVTNFQKYDTEIENIFDSIDSNLLGK
jgi:hypothetical protein